MITTESALFILRIVVGAVFLAHGTNKLRTWSKKTAFMRFIGIAETAGAIGLFAGVLTQYAAAGLAIIMAGAIYMKAFKWNVPFDSEEMMGCEYDLVLLAASLVIIAAGPGKYVLGPVLGLRV